MEGRAGRQLTPDKWSAFATTAFQFLDTGLLKPENAASTYPLLKLLCPKTF